MLQLIDDVFLFCQMPEQDKMVQCPYNEAHNILAYRMATHLAKCRKQHPGAPLRRCPFNTTHDVPAPEFEVSLLWNCPLASYLYFCK